MKFSIGTEDELLEIMTNYLYNTKESSKKKVLLVDDEKDLLELISCDFEEAGYDVSTASDGPSALKAIRENEFSLIVSDNHMPGFTGLELLEYVKKQRYKTPVYILSGNIEIKNEVLAAGAEGFFDKPCLGEDILKKVS